MKLTGSPEGSCENDDNDYSVWNRRPRDLTVSDVKNCQTRRDIKGFRDRMLYCLSTLGEVRASLDRGAAVVRDNGGILLVGDEVQESDAVVLPEEESALHFLPPTFKSSHAVAFQPRIRHSDDEASFQEALVRLMRDYEEPEAENIIVEKDSRFTDNEGGEHIDPKGRRVLTESEVKAIRKRAERNYRKRGPDGRLVYPTYELRLKLREGDRLCVLPDGRTLEEYLAQLARAAGSMPILQGRYTQSPPTRRIRIGYSEYIEQGVGGGETNVMSMLADKLNKTSIVQPPELVEAVFLGDKGEYELRRIATRDTLAKGDVCAVIHFPGGGVAAYRRANGAKVEIALDSKLMGISDSSVKTGVVTEIKEEEYHDGSGKRVDIMLIDSNCEVRSSSLSGNGIEVERHDFDVSYGVKYDKGDDGSKVERCEEPPWDVVFKVVRKPVKEA